MKKQWLERCRKRIRYYEYLIEVAKALPFASEKVREQWKAVYESRLEQECDRIDRG